MARSTTDVGPFTFQGFDARTELMRGPVRPKKGPSEPQGGSSNRSGNGGLTQFLQRVSAVSRKTPEVMVRITGGAKGKQHLQEHLAYVTRNGKLEATNERGEVIKGREEVKELAQEWSLAPPRKTPNRQAPDTRNLMLSMPKGTDEEKVLRAAKTFADKTFADERAYALVLHTDKGHPHVHLTLKTRGFDGRNLHPRKADLQQWREDFAKELRELGIAAEATPRRTRGVVQKPKTQAVFHMERDHAAGKRERAPETQLKKFAEAVKELTGREGPKVRPWELKIAERQQKVRGAWLATADTLDKTGSQDSRQLAKQIRDFVAGMPPVMTERQRIQAQVAAGLQRGRGRGPDRG